MKPLETDHLFQGTIPELYEQRLVPMIFETYAEDMASRVLARKPSSILEIAAGTGVLTRRMSAILPDSVMIVATDLNPGMLAIAKTRGTARQVHWQTADALDLPFPDSTFDLVVCQFGAMFFPDRNKAFVESRRVLKPGGAFLFSTWDGIETNEFAATTESALQAFFPEDPPRFISRTPHGYFDLGTIRNDLESAGFEHHAEITTLERRSPAESAEMAAIAYCQGTPVRGEIEKRGPGRLGEATAAVAAALAVRFGRGAIDGKILAHVVAVAT